MIHHVSIPARDPGHVAAVLAELMGGRCYPFGPLKGAYMAVSGDAHGSMIEVYPDGAVLETDGGEGPVTFSENREPPRFWPVHLLLSVPLDEAAIAQIGAREGWRTKLFGRGVPGRTPFFHVIEFWLENRLMLEVVTPAMARQYEEFLQFSRIEATMPGWRDHAPAVAAAD